MSAAVRDRFWARVEAPSQDDCWAWTGPVSAAGYGYASHRDHATRLAHRIAYMLEVGPIPDGLTLDHLCRVRHCVNPRHLEPVTQAENNRRASVALRDRRGGLLNPHQYRIDDDDYEAAMRAAEARDERLSEEIRKFVVRYGKAYKKPKGEK